MKQDSSALRPLLIYGAILASAVLLGITLTSRFDYQSLAFLAGIFGLLVSPLLLRWHLFIMFGIWNSAMGLYFLPGQPPLWLLWALVSLTLVWIERSFFRDREFVNVTLLTRALGLFAAVVIVTMIARGGIGIRWIGSGELAGGRKYLYILGAMLGYFAMSLKPVPAERANLFIGLYFLGGLVAFIGPLSVWLGPPFDRLQYVFHPSEGVLASDGMFRVKGLSTVGMGIVGWLLSRYGFGGVFHQRRLWRPLLLVGGMGIGLLSGYRTLLVMFAVTLGGLFFLEGWHRTRWLWAWIMAGLVCLAVAVPITPHLPPPIQRAIAFLPLPVDPSVRFDAEGTIEWRYGLYDALADDVPRYFWLGKGMTINTLDMDWAETLSRFGGKQWDYSYITGEHHNGFFSVIIAFGVWGLLAFAGFIGVGFWVLLQNYRFGEERLRSVNGFLLLNYIGWVLLFFSYWGTLYWSMRDFAGILGLAVALNGGMALAPDRDPEAEQGHWLADPVRSGLRRYLR
jgi:hypothetical protein